MVCSCVVPSKRVLLQIIFCSCVIGTTFSKEKWQIASLSCQEVIKIWKQSWWSNDETIIELGYHKRSRFASVSQINYLQIIYLLATDKSQYFAQPRPIIVNYFNTLNSWSTMTCIRSLYITFLCKVYCVTLQKDHACNVLFLILNPCT